MRHSYDKSRSSSLSWTWMICVAWILLLTNLSLDLCVAAQQERVQLLRRRYHHRLQETNSKTEMTNTPAIHPTHEVIQSTIASTIRKDSIENHTSEDIAADNISKNTNNNNNTTNPTNTNTTTLSPSEQEFIEEFIEKEEEILKKKQEVVAEEVGGISLLIGITFMIFTAYQMSENPDGVCASLCRLTFTLAGCFIKIILWPFKKLCGHRFSGYAHHLVATQEYGETSLFQIS